MFRYAATNLLKITVRFSYCILHDIISSKFFSSFYFTIPCDKYECHMNRP